MAVGQALGPKVLPFTEGVAAGTAAVLAIRDGNAHFSDWIDAAIERRILVVLENTLDKAVTCTLQGSMTKAANEIKDLPGGVLLAVGNVTEQIDAISLSDPWPFVRVKFVAASAPAAGNVSGHYAGRGVAA